MQNKYLNLFLSTALLFAACKNEDKQNGEQSATTNVATPSTKEKKKQIEMIDMIEGLHIVETKKFHDERGYFFERKKNGCDLLLCR